MAIHYLRIGTDFPPITVDIPGPLTRLFQLISESCDEIILPFMAGIFQGMQFPSLIGCICSILPIIISLSLSEEPPENLIVFYLFGIIVGITLINFATRHNEVHVREPALNLIQRD